MANVNYPYIMLMKVGPYCGYSLDEIIDIKQKEEEKCGKFFWGYSGVFCRPYVVQNFVTQTLNNNEEPTLLFTETKSSFTADKVNKFSEFSTDKSKWVKLPDDVLLVGNKSRPHFAITAKKLKNVDMTLNLSDYCVLRGMFPDKSSYLGRYFRYRVDKACAVYLPKDDSEENEIQVIYSCVLTEPYGVYIR